MTICSSCLCERSDHNFKVLNLKICTVTTMAIENNKMRTIMESVKKMAVEVSVSQSIVRI